MLQLGRLLLTPIMVWMNVLPCPTGTIPSSGCSLREVLALLGFQVLEKPTSYRLIVPVHSNGHIRLSLEWSDRSSQGARVLDPLGSFSTSMWGKLLVFFTPSGSFRVPCQIGQSGYCSQFSCLILFTEDGFITLLWSWLLGIWYCFVTIEAFSFVIVLSQASCMFLPSRVPIWTRMPHKRCKIPSSLSPSAWNFLFPHFNPFSTRVTGRLPCFSLLIEPKR